MSRPDSTRHAPNRVRAAAVATIVAVFAFAAAAGASRAQEVEQSDHETTEIAEGVYQFRWQTHNSLFVVGEDGVLVVDPIGPEAARQLAVAVRERAPGKPLHTVAYSHDHADHASGAPTLFGELNRAPIVAHELAEEKIAAQDNPDLPPPDITFSGETHQVVDLGDRHVELRYLGKSHSDNMIVAYLPEEKIVFAVDFVSNDRVGYRDLPDYHYPEFLEAMRRLQELNYETVVFGHGPPGGPEAVDRQIRYYEALRDAVAEALDAGLTRDEAAERVELPEFADWAGYEDWLELNVRAMYGFLTEQTSASPPPTSSF